MRGRSNQENTLCKTLPRRPFQVEVPMLANRILNHNPQARLDLNFTLTIIRPLVLALIMCF